MVVASVNNIMLTVAYVLAYKLVPRTWGRLTRAAFEVCRPLFSLGHRQIRLSDTRHGCSPVQVQDVYSCC